jgi:hypothetical protein
VEQERSKVVSEGEGGDKLTRFSHAQRVRPLRLSINACPRDRKVSLGMLAAFIYVWLTVLRCWKAVQHERCCSDIDNKEEEDLVPR